MKVPAYVRPKPKAFNLIPVLGKYTANSIYPWIFVPRGVYQDLLTSSPNPRHLALLIHEQEHYQRQKRMGMLLFGIRYLFSSKFRFNEELIAVKAAMKYLKRRGIPFDFDGRAKFLSSYLYLWPVSKEYAEKELRKIWAEV